MIQIMTDSYDDVGDDDDDDDDRDDDDYNAVYHDTDYK